MIRDALPLAPRVEPPCTDDHCVTCADEGVPMRVVELIEAGLARCTGDDGADVDVMIGIVDAVRVGDVLLVHAGAALARLADEREAGA